MRTVLKHLRLASIVSCSRSINCAGKPAIAQKSVSTTGYKLQACSRNSRLFSTFMTKELTYDLEIETFLDRIRDVNSTPAELETLFSFYCNEEKLGGIREHVAAYLEAYPEVFSVDYSSRTVSVRSGLKTSEDRTKAIGMVMEDLREKGIVEGWRNELFPVSARFGETPFFLLERAAVLILGIKAYGVHINGYTIKDGEIFMWDAKRSATKQTWPSKLDHIVAGGQPFGVGLMENVIKECEEEAGISKELAETAKPAGVVSYSYLQENGFKQDVIFVYDLLLPESFIPTPNDGEVEEFRLRHISEIAETILKTKNYKPNCALVIIDFLVRHGIISPDQKGYLELIKRIRSGELV